MITLIEILKKINYEFLFTFINFNFFIWTLKLLNLDKAKMKGANEWKIFAKNYNDVIKTVKKVLKKKQMRNI